MKNAIEFVKKFGLYSFKAAMICPQFKRYDYAILYSDEVDFSNKFIEKHADYMFKTSDIKRLVESHEVVSNFGGLKRAKRILKKAYTSFNILVTVVWNDKPFQCTVEQLQKAIEEVESCL